MFQHGDSKGLYILGAAGLALAGLYFWKGRGSGGDSSGADSGWDSSGGGSSGAAPGPESSSGSWLDTLAQSIGIVGPKGERNNNPGNIRYVASIQWQGQIGDDGTGYSVFDTAENGIRALGRQLRTDINRGQNTVALIIGGDLSRGFYGYAPPNENDTAAYITDVSQRIGVDPNQPLDAGAIPVLAQAMIIHEEGRDSYGIESIAAWSTEA